MFYFILLAIALTIISGSSAQSSSQMMLGVDEAGSSLHIYDDPFAIAAFEEIGFDFLMHHAWGNMPTEEFMRLDGWAAKYKHSFFLNFENSDMSRTQAPSPPYIKPGCFLHPPKELVNAAKSSPRFLGIVYDEAEHWTTNGVGVTPGWDDFVPHFYNAQGDTLLAAYQGNMYNLQVLMNTSYPGLAANAKIRDKYPIIATENVFPIMHHLFARAGMVQMPKLLKETMVPVAIAMTMGAAKQYGIRYWTSVDLWQHNNYPGHTPQDMKSALLFSYWTGAEHTYIENFAYQGSLYSVVNGKVKLSPHGEIAKWFKREYLPNNPRSIDFKDFAPEIIIVRFEDTSWGQTDQGDWCRSWLYGASNLRRDQQTDYWFKIWNVLSHGVIPGISLNFNVDAGIPYRFFIPANNVAVYDHLASDPGLYDSAKLVFLTGKMISPECMATLDELVENGLVVVTPSHLAPIDMTIKPGSVYTEYKRGLGKWIVTDDVTDSKVRTLLRPYLGKSDQMRYVFGSDEVVFTMGSDGVVKVKVSPMVVHVTPEGDDSKDGKSWDTAKRSIQAAISAAATGGDVWVKAGEYRECVELAPFVHLFGGFAGTESARSQRDYVNNVTVINGNQQGTTVRAFGIAYGTATIDGFTITGGNRDGIYLTSASPIIRNNRIVNNTGSGIRSYSSLSTISHNYISGNVSSAYGGGIYSNGSLTIVNNIIARNTAGISGGGIYMEPSSLACSVSYNTIVENTAAAAGGVYINSSSVNASHNIIAFNSPGGSAVYGSSDYNCVFNPDEFDYHSSWLGTGNFFEDPLFVNRTAGDYRLAINSPCVNAGHNDAPDMPVLDFDGNPRVRMGVVDIGAYERGPAKNAWEAKQARDGFDVNLAGAVVTAAYEDAFYIESDDRLTGIRVEKAGHGLAQGSRATVNGVTAVNDDGERCIYASDAVADGSGTILPLFVNAKSVGGAAFGFQQATGSWKWGKQSDNTWKLEWLPDVGLNNIGLLIKTAGQVTHAGEGFFYIDDGSKKNDNSGFTGVKVLGSVPVGPGQNPVGCFVTVTGISSCEKTAAGLVSVIRTRAAGDVVVIR